VRVVILPDNPNNYDIVWMEAFKKHAREQDAKVLYAGVGIGNIDQEKAPIYLNQDYLLEYNGIQVLDTNLN
jgi:hypothetical protein